MQQFDLSLWLKDKSRKVVTRESRPVRIVCWDVKGLFPILALIEGNGERDTKVGEEYPCCYKIDGTCPVTESYDLFFADEEEELTEFEDGLFSLVSEFWQKHSLLNEEVDIAELVKENSKILLDLARNEILKDLPKWKKSTEHKDLEMHIAILEDNKVLLSNYLEEGDYYIVLDDLKTLPKEE